MKVVQPIRDGEIIQKCFAIARAHDRKRKKGEISWELLLTAGFNTSLRVSDFSRLRVRDLYKQDYVRIQAKKTGKDARILINPQARDVFNRLLAGRSADEYVFLSRKKDRGTHLPKPITRQRAYQIMNIIAKKAGIQERIGCHTLRKTFGYHYYKATGDVVKLQGILQHSSAKTTLIYIGIIQEEIDESLMHFGIVAGRKLAWE